MKPGVNRLIKGSVEGVEEFKGTTGEHVKRERPCWPVQEYSYFVGVGFDGYRIARAIGQGFVWIFVAVQAPGGVIST